MSSLNPFLRDQSGNYYIDRSNSASPDQVIAKAKQLLARRLRKGETALTSPSLVRDYLIMHLSAEANEMFWGLFLDNRHRVLEHCTLSVGTIDSASVYPRTVIQKAITINAAAVIFAHNHPSGVAEPSDTDVRLTKKLTDALALIDIRVLDHLIVGHDHTTSLAERGLM